MSCENETPEEDSELRLIYGLSKHSWSVAITWGKLISSAHLADRATVVEIASGHSPKVGVGLLRALPNFCGTLFIIEPDDKALEKVVHFYEKMFTQAVVVGINAVLSSAAYYLPLASNIDMVLANHPLDDMIIGRDLAAGNINFVEYFSCMYIDNTAEKKKIAEEAAAWHQLEYERPCDCENFKLEVVADWISFLEIIRPQHFAVSQYESRTLKEFNVEAPDRLALELLINLAGKLPPMSNNSRVILCEQGFDPNRWIVSKMKFKKHLTASETLLLLRMDSKRLLDEAGRRRRSRDMALGKTAVRPVRLVLHEFEDFTASTIKFIRCYPTDVTIKELF